MRRIFRKEYIIVWNPVSKNDCLYYQSEEGHGTRTTETTFNKEYARKFATKKEAYKNMLRMSQIGYDGPTVVSV